MIDVRYLTSRINEELGADKYVVWLNTNVFPENIGDRNVVVMNISRVPFSFTIKQLDVENLHITLTFDVPVSQEGAELVTRDMALLDIQEKLLGWKEFIVELPTEDVAVTKNYLVTAKFEQQPLGLPYADSGRITQQIVVSGTALVQSIDCAVVLGNQVSVSIDGCSLLRMARASSIQVGSDNNLLLSEEKTLPETFGVSRVATKTVSFLYTGKEVEKEFLMIAEGCSHDVNKLYDYEVSYPGDILISQKVKIVGVSTQDDLGVYMQYTLTMQVVDFEELDADIGGGSDTGDTGGDTGDSGDTNGGGDTTETPGTGEDTETGGGSDTGDGDSGSGDGDTGDSDTVMFDYDALLEVFESETSLSKNGIIFTFSHGESSQLTPYNNRNQSVIKYYERQVLRFTTNGEAITGIEIVCKGDLTEEINPFDYEADGQLTMYFEGAYTYIVWTPNVDISEVELIVALNYLEVISITVTKSAIADEEPI